MVERSYQLEPASYVGKEMMVEVNAADREQVMHTFEIVKFDVRDWFHLDSCAHLQLIKEQSGRMSIHVYNSSMRINALKTLAPKETSDLIRLFQEMGTDSWTEVFLPEFPFLDGYSWTLGVYAEDHYYMCSGSNTLPIALANFLGKIEGFGLPSLLDDEGEPYFVLDKCV